MSMPEDRAMKTLSTAVLGRHIGGCALVIDAVSGAPVVHGIGNQFAIISDENF